MADTHSTTTNLAKPDACSERGAGLVWSGLGGASAQCEQLDSLVRLLTKSISMSNYSIVGIREKHAYGRWSGLTTMPKI